MSPELQQYTAIVSTLAVGVGLINAIFAIIAYFQRRPTVRYNKEKLRKLKKKREDKNEPT